MSDSFEIDVCVSTRRVRFEGHEYRIRTDPSGALCVGASDRGDAVWFALRRDEGGRPVVGTVIPRAASPIAVAWVIGCARAGVDPVATTARVA